MSVKNDKQSVERPSDTHERAVVPSRVAILDALEKAGAPSPMGDIAAALGVEGKPALLGLKRRLRAMERDGQLVYTRSRRFGLAERMELMPGRIIGHADGHAFVRPDQAGDDIFIAPRQARRTLHGDRVLVRIAGLDNRERPYGDVVEILERANSEVVGRYFREQGVGFVIPDNRRISQDVLIYEGAEGGAKNGQIVVATIEQQPDARHQPIGRITQVLGEHLAPGLEVDIAIRTHGLPTEWPDAVAQELTRIPQEVDQNAAESRRDLRHLAFVTIDGADARDFDDAVFCLKAKEIYTLYVAIADVSAYVESGSELDRAALERGTSVYFPDRVVPMLPERLSNGICSLNPNVDRLAMVCELQINGQGVVERSRFYEAVINSRARLTYDQVAVWIANRQPDEKGPAPQSHVRQLYDLYQTLRRRRDERGALDIDTVEPRFIFNDERKIDRIEPIVRNDAHRMIEECMIVANVAAAQYLLAAGCPALFRVHDRPDPEKLDNLRQFLNELGMHLGGGAEASAKTFATVLEEARQRPDRTLIETVLLRSLKLAVYSSKNIGHFGLALDAYTHFTSPIRRYPDLAVHRAIKLQLNHATPQGEQPDVAALGEHCSMTERRAADASRDAIAWLKCEYMLDKIGEKFSGIVSSVTSFGLFVQLDEIFVEGLIHVTSLPQDYYHYDAVGHRLSGRKGGAQYRVGQQIEVLLTRVSLDDRQIDFEPVGARPPARRKRKLKS